MPKQEIVGRSRDFGEVSAWLRLVRREDVSRSEEVVPVRNKIGIATQQVVKGNAEHEIYDAYDTYKGTDTCQYFPPYRHACVTK